MNFFLTALYYFASALTLYIASVTVQDKTFPKKRKIGIFIFSLCIAFGLSPFLQQCATIFVLFGTSILLTYKLPNKIQNLISFFLGYLLLVCCDYIFSCVAYLGFGITVSEIQKDYLILYLVIYFPVFFFLAKMLQWVLHKKLRLQSFLHSETFAWGILGNFAINVLIFAFLIIFGERAGYSPKIILFNGILFFTCFVLSNILFIIVYRTKSKENDLEVQLIQYENLTSYTHEVEQLYQNMRAFKHDYTDLISTLKLYIDKNDTEKLSDYFYKVIIPFGKEMTLNDNQLGKLSYIEQDVIKSLIFSKLLLALEKKLHLEIELRQSIPQFPMKELDLIRILGIFLNNAIEAASDSDEKELTFAVVRDSEYTAILIRNSSKTPVIPLHKLCDNGISSKSSHDGIGLYTAKQILDSYVNVTWNFHYEAPYFMTELTFHQERSNKI